MGSTQMTKEPSCIAQVSPGPNRMSLQSLRRVQSATGFCNKGISPWFPCCDKSANFVFPFEGSVEKACLSDRRLRPDPLSCLTKLPPHPGSVLISCPQCQCTCNEIDMGRQTGNVSLRYSFWRSSFLLFSTFAIATIRGSSTWFVFRSFNCSSYCLIATSDTLRGR